MSRDIFLYSGRKILQFKILITSHIFPAYKLHLTSYKKTFSNGNDGQSNKNFVVIQTWFHRFPKRNFRIQNFQQ